MKESCMYRSSVSVKRYGRGGTEVCTEVSGQITCKGKKNEGLKLALEWSS